MPVIKFEKPKKSQQLWTDIQRKKIRLRRGEIGRLFVGITLSKFCAPFSSLFQVFFPCCTGARSLVCARNPHRMRLPTFHRRFFSCACALALLCAALPAHAAQKGSFSDVPPGSETFDAAEYLKGRGIMTGYADGTFKAEKKVNRAEALKIIVAPFLSEAQAAKYKTTAFADIAADAWYIPYVEWARAQGGVIDSPPKSTTFRGSQSVTKAEFLKMFMQTRKIDPKSFGDIALPLSRDVSDVKEWSYPYMRYAIASSMIVATKDGLYTPAKQLSRGDVAVILYRFFLYREGLRTQSLLSETEKELAKTINALAERNQTGANYTSVRALLMTRGAHEIRPDESTVKVPVKIAEGYRALVRAFDAAQKGDWASVRKLSSDAWYLGDQAKKISPKKSKLAAQLQEYATSFGKQARDVKN